MEHDKLIEAMARAMENAIGESLIGSEFLATAALKALRDTLEPVFYVVKEEDGPVTSYIVSDDKEVPPYAECAPLYALPEVKP